MGDLYVCIRLGDEIKFTSRSGLRKMHGTRKADTIINSFCEDSRVKTDWGHLESRRLQGRSRKSITYPSQRRINTARRIDSWHTSDESDEDENSVEDLEDLLRQMSLSQKKIMKRLDILEGSRSTRFSRRSLR